MSLSVMTNPLSATVNRALLPFAIPTNPAIFSFRVTVYNEPHLRVAVDLTRDPIHWIPAKDFDHVFTVLDPKKGSGGREGGGVAEVWDLVEEEGNIPWDLNSKKPLYKYSMRKLINRG